MKGIKRFFAKVWLPSLTGVVMIGLTVGILFYKLGSITPGLSPAEVEALQGVGSLRAILENPIFLPFKLGEYLVLKLGLDLPIAVRGVSALFGAVCVWGFYLLLKRWHTRRIAIIGTVLFLCSTWFLATARTALPDILYVFNVLSIIFIGALVHQKKASRTSLLLAAISAALLVYSPGMIWLLVFGGIWQYKGIVSLLKQNPVWLWLSAWVLFMTLLLPIGYAVFLNHNLVFEIMAIPDPLVPLDMLKRILLVPKELLIQGPREVWWVGRQPLLDIFTGAMCAVGIYNYYLRIKLSRTLFLLWLGVVLVLLIAILNIPTIVVLPLLYILITGGITLLLQQWFTVFPLNPIARNMGLIIMLCAVGVSCWFQLNRYFVAWRYNDVTQASYYLILKR